MRDTPQPTWTDDVDIAVWGGNSPEVRLYLQQLLNVNQVDWQGYSLQKHPIGYPGLTFYPDGSVEREPWPWQVTFMPGLQQ